VEEYRDMLDESQTDTDNTMLHRLGPSIKQGERYKREKRTSERVPLSVEMDGFYGENNHGLIVLVPNSGIA